MTKSYYLDYREQPTRLLIDCMVLASYHGLGSQYNQILEWVKHTAVDNPAIDLIESICLIGNRKFSDAEEKLRQLMLRTPEDPHPKSLLALMMFENGKHGYDQLLHNLTDEQLKAPEVACIVEYIAVHRGVTGFEPSRSRLETV